MSVNASAERPIRVLLVSPLPPPPGGIETWTQTLQERGLPAPFDFEIVDTKAFRGHSQSPINIGTAEVKRNLRILWRVRRALASGRFAVMHLNCALATFGVARELATARMARRAKVPYIAHLRGTFSLPPGNGPAALFYRWAYRTIFSGAASILALGQPSYKAILELGDFAHKTRPLMPNFVDFGRVCENSAKPEQAAPFKVIFTGALIEAKGVHTVVETARRLPNARFQLVGDGPAKSRANLLKHIREQCLDDRVKVNGPLSNSQVMAMLPEYDAFLFPSKFKYEGFSNSVAEAMAAGLPVVASPVGAIPEMIDVPQGGFLAPPDDADAYAGALQRLQDSPSLQRSMGQHNRQKARQEYDYDVVVRQLCDLYSQIAIPPALPLG